MASNILEVLLFGADGSLNRAKTFSGFLFVFLIVWYFFLIAVDSIQNGEFVLLKSTDLWNLGIVGGTVLISVWLGYSGGGLVVASAVGLTPGIAFAAIGVTLTVLNLNEPDASILFFVIVLSIIGLLMAISGFVIGTGIQFAIGGQR